MMNGKTWMIGAICAALLPLAALAQGDGPARFRGGFGGEAALLKGVNLSAEQQTAIQTIRQNARTQNKPVMQQLRSVEEQIHSALLASGSVNMSALTALQTQASQLRSQLESARLAARVAVRNTLTSEQLATAAATDAQLHALHQQERSLMHPAATDSTTAQ
jgi:Spy/CpxP family protein refolding chaperone